MRRGSDVTFSTLMGVTDVQLTGAALPRGVPEPPGLTDPVGLPDTDGGTEGEAGLPLGDPLGLFGLAVPLSVAVGVGWLPPPDSTVQPDTARPVIKMPGKISFVAPRRSAAGSNADVGMR
ncbi:MAG TPA: hypothetical protein VIT42_19605 [Microlunatus sp.]